jgi:hypothetical protein
MISLRAPRLAEKLSLCAIALAVLGGALLAQPSVADGSSRPLGVVSQTDPSEAEFEAMRRGGVGTYRWLVSWPSLQTSADAPPDWSATDRIVTNLAKNDIRPLPMIQGSPCFVVDCSRIPPERAHNSPPLGSPQARRAWSDFLGELVGRYGPDGTFWSANPAVPYRPIGVWQIWNEQNAPKFYAPSPSVEGYAELLAISSQAIRSRDPEAQILLGGMFGDPSEPGSIEAPRFLDELYGIPGTERNFDGVAVHPYSRDVAGVEQQMLDIRRVIEANGDAETPIWVTELGWGSGDGPRGRLIVTPAGQARRLGEAFGLLLARRDDWNLAGALWFAWRDTSDPNVCDWCRTAGLISEDGSAKDSWIEYAELSGGTPVAPADIPSPGAPPPVPGRPSPSPVGSPSSDDRPPVLLLIGGALALAAAAGAWILRRRRAGDPEPRGDEL